MQWLRPLLRREWPAYEVHFPTYSRVIATPVCTLSGQALGAALAGLTHSADIAEVAPDRLTLADGSAIHAGVVLDGRGARPSRAFRCGWQKFLGQELRLTAPHGLRHPILMDARVEQIDGFRFIYVLPFGPDRLLVEDTCYSDTPELSLPRARKEIAAYVAANGWHVAEQLSEETGVLPVVLDGDIGAFWSEVGPVPPLAPLGPVGPVLPLAPPGPVGPVSPLAPPGPVGPTSEGPSVRGPAGGGWFLAMPLTKVWSAGLTDPGLLKVPFIRITDDIYFHEAGMLA